MKHATDSVVLATPEYHGSFSSVMKLVIENLGFPSALQGKPVALMAWLTAERSAPSSHWSNCAVSRLTWARLSSAHASVGGQRAIGVRSRRPYHGRRHREHDSRRCSRNVMEYIHGNVSARDAGTVDAPKAPWRSAIELAVGLAVATSE